MGSHERSSERRIGTGANPSLDGDQLLGVGLLPEVEPRIVDRLRQQPVGDHRVDGVAEEREIGVGAAGLGHDQPFRGDDQAHARAVTVAEQQAHRLQAVEDLLAGAEHLVARDRQRRDPTEHRRHDLVEPPAHREEAVDVPAEHVGQREQPQRLGRRCAVDHDDIPFTAVGVVGQVGEGEHLVEPGHDGELLGLDALDPGPGQDLEQPRPDVAPRPLEAQAGVELLAREVLADRSGRCRPGARRRRRPGCEPGRSRRSGCGGPQRRT